MSCNTFLQNRISTIQAQIIAYETASSALANGGIQSYTLDTGQSVQKVTKLDLASLQKTIEGLYNQLVVLEARCTGNGSIVSRPAW